MVRTPDILAIVLEYVEGGALSGVVRKFGSLPESLVRMYTRQILLGLAYLHKEGVIHRDIKGANILVTKNSSVKLADFGVASRLAKNTGLAEDSPESVVGTPYWMAPEIIELSGVTSACDIWSLGCTIIELLTGAPPYFDLQPMPALFRIVQDDHPPLPNIAGLSNQLEDFLLQCFQKEPALRVSAQQLLRHPWVREGVPEGHKKSISEREPETRDPEAEDILDDDTGEVDMARITRQKKKLKERQLERFKRYSMKRESQIIQAIAKGQTTADNIVELDDPQPPRRRDADSDEKDWTNVRERLKKLERSLSSLSTTAKTEMEAKHHRTNTMGTLVTGGDSDSDDEAFRKALAQQEEAQDDQIIAKEVDSELAKTPLRRDEKMSSTPVLTPGVSRGLRDSVGSEPPPKTPSSNPPAVISLQFGDDDDDDNFGDLEIGQPGPNQAHAAPKHTEHKSADDDDPFEGLLDDQSAAETYSRLAATTKEMVARLGTHTVVAQLQACNDLVQLLRDHPSVKGMIVTSNGLLPLRNILRSHPVDSRAHLAALRVISKLLEGESQYYCEILCLEGFTPVIAAATCQGASVTTRHLAVYFIWKLCHVSERTLAMCIACGGLELIASFVGVAWDTWHKIVRMGIQCLWRVFEVEITIPKSDVCHSLASAGVIDHMASLLTTLRESDDDGDATTVLLPRITNLMLSFAKVDALTVRQAITQPRVLTAICDSLTPETMDPSAILNLLKCIKILSMDPNALAGLEGAGVVSTLVVCLDYYVAVDVSKEHQNQILNSLFHLCKLNRRRQEEAALAGLVPHLQEFINLNSPLKQFALPIICEFAHANNQAREILWQSDGVDFFMSLLYQEYWQVKALEALNVWLSEERHRVEPLLLQPQNIRTMIDLFDPHPNNYFQNLLDPFLSLLTASPRLRQAVGVTSILPRILERLSHPNSIVRVRLLQIIHILFESMSTERQIFTAYHLGPLLQVTMCNESALLVREMANRILGEFVAVVQSQTQHA
eukprot:c12626_g1_i2.p1 GENE.c12626_g1_i2~~c12626_g1_i2.p1  ORF type:complete len:1006 (+),score=281.74 c12626_g1_i2:443-3460(+)